MIAVTRLQDLPAAFDALLVLAIGIVAVTFAWTVFMFVRGWWAETHPTGPAVTTPTGSCGCSSCPP